MAARDCKNAQRGLSLLEVTLAMGIMTGLSFGIFLLLRTQQQTVSTVMAELKGSRQAAEALSLISTELANASASTIVLVESDFGVTYQPASGGATRRIRLAPLNPANPADPNYSPMNRALEFDRDVSDTEPPSILLPARMVLNHNPDEPARGIQARPLQQPTTNTTTTAPIPIFAAPTSSRIQVYLVIQAKPDTPVRYLRTSVTLRN